MQFTTLAQLNIKLAQLKQSGKPLSGYVQDVLRAHVQNRFNTMDANGNPASYVKLVP